MTPAEVLYGNLVDTTLALQDGLKGGVAPAFRKKIQVFSQQLTPEGIIGSDQHRVNLWLDEEPDRRTEALADPFVMEGKHLMAGYGEWEQKLWMMTVWKNWFYAQRYA